MIKKLYKRILKKLNLPADQLQELKNRLTHESICKGAFVQGEKNCPNTTALATKEGVDKFREANEVKKLLAKYGVGRIELWTFYVIFDLPAMISERFFERRLREMRHTVDELIKSKSDRYRKK